MATEGGLFWTYNREDKKCWIKTSDSDRRHLAEAISGSRACGLSNRTISAKLTSVAVVVSHQNENHPPALCADGNKSTICVVESSSAPWLALYLGSKARVDKVEIRHPLTGVSNRNGVTPWINKVLVADSLPSSGAHFMKYFNFIDIFLDNELFTDGTLLGAYRGPAHTAVTPIEATSNEPSPRGYYVILQKDSASLEGHNQQLRVAEFAAFGRRGIESEGPHICLKEKV